MSKCELHDVLVEDLREVKSDVKKIREVLIGNGEPGLIGRIQKLEFVQGGLSATFFRVLNIAQALLVAYLTYKFLEM